VLKNIHHCINPEVLKPEINSKGHIIINMRQRITKESLSMFFVGLKPAVNNKDIYDINLLAKQNKI